MSKLGFSLVSFFLMISSSCYGEDSQSTYDCTLCAKERWWERSPTYDVLYELRMLFEQRKSELYGTIRPGLDSYMPRFQSFSKIVLKWNKSWHTPWDILFYRQYNTCLRTIRILKQVPDDSLWSGINESIDESTARNNGLIWDPTTETPTVRIEITCYDKIPSDYKRIYTSRWYSSTSAFYSHLRNDINDVYSLSFLKLNEHIKEIEKRIDIYRKSSIETPNLYSPDEEQCLCIKRGSYFKKCINCNIKFEKYLLAKANKEFGRRHEEPSLYLACVDRLQEQARLFYQNKYAECIKRHKNPWAFYQYGLIYFEQGEFEKSLKYVRKLLKAYQNEKKLDQLPPKVFFDKGVLESQLEHYHDAILSLSYVLEKDPNHKEAHFERAIAYFEEGSFDLALQDYLASGMKPDWGITAYKEFGAGLVEGIQRGIKEEFQDTLPIAVPIMSVGMWALTKTPTVYAKYVSASMACVAAAAVYMKADEMTTEMRYLVTNWDKLSQQQQGTLCGYLIGKYGIDIFAVAGSAKMMEAYQNLKRANSMLTFELMLTPEYEIGVLKAKFKGVEKYKQDKKYIQQVCGKKTYPEHEIRNTLKRMGYEIPKKPDCIPSHFETRYADKIGICYHDPANPNHEYIRLMPGSSYNPYSIQQKPYVMHMRNGAALDIEGNPVSPKNPAAHIPVESYVYRSLQ